MNTVLFLITTFCFYCSFLFAQNIFSEQIIISSSAQGARCIDIADLDGDHDLDILAACDAGNKVVWYENTDGKAHFSKEKVITSQAERAWSVFSADLDSDHDLDVLVVSLFKNQVIWFENTDSLGHFGEQKVISELVDHPTCVCAYDLDGDADVDVLSASSGDDKIAWYKNTDGCGHFSEQIVITTQMEQTSFVCAADIDGDNDMDIVAAAYHNNNIVWYENTNGLGVFDTVHIVSTIPEQVESLWIADLDADNDPDLISASWGDEKIAWYKNIDGKGNFANPQYLNSSANIHNSVFSADLDGDSDMDILSASSDDLIAWYENVDGKGNFSASKVISTNADDAMDVYAADLDNDGDMDAISASWFDNKIAWYENLLNTVFIKCDQPQLPEKIQLYQNYPNPFNPSTNIRFTLSKSEQVSLKIYTIDGREVTELINGIQSTGEHHVIWQTNGLVSGIYLARLKAGSEAKTMKLILQK